MKTGRRLLLTAIFIHSFFFIGCRKEYMDDGHCDFTINLNIFSDGRKVLADSTWFQHPAGYQYQVNRLSFYLSGMELIREDGEVVYRPEPLYFDVSRNNQLQWVLRGIPGGRYTGFRFLLGLDSLHNISRSLPNFTENINMEWPDAMGGGYHFMKLEGYYRDSSGLYGYAMHLGKNRHLVKIIIVHPFKVEHGQAPACLLMNLAEWFRNPVVYDFNTDGNYSMGSDEAMLKLKSNGSDIFSME